MSNLIDDVMANEFKPIETHLWTVIKSRIKQSDNYRVSGVIRLSYIDYEGVCSNRIFSSAIKKFLEYELILSTPKAKYYIVNPLYTNKFFRIKEEPKE